MDVDSIDPVRERIREKHAKKQEQAKEVKASFKEAIEEGEKKLACERTPNGLYYLSFKGGGQLPEELRGKFTSIDRIRNLVVKRYGKDIIAWQ